MLRKKSNVMIFNIVMMSLLIVRIIVLFILVSLVFFASEAIFRRRRQVIASGTLLVTGKDEIIIDQQIPYFSRMLAQPHKHVFVKLDDEPPVPPFMNAGPDSVSWTLCHEHFHNEKGRCKNYVKLKIAWSVSSSRTIAWRVVGKKSY